MDLADVLIYKLILLNLFYKLGHSRSGSTNVNYYTHAISHPGDE